MMWRRLTIGQVPRQRFVDGLSSLFSAPDTSAQQAAATTARDQQGVELERQRQQQQNQEATTDATTGRIARIPRGRRLLLAATGESGVAALPSTLN